MVEFGISFGLSAIGLAAVLRANGGGKVVTTEIVVEKVAIARHHFDEVGLKALIEIRKGWAKTPDARLRCRQAAGAMHPFPFCIPCALR